MPAPMETGSFSSKAAYRRHRVLVQKARRRAAMRLATLYPVQFEQLVLVELAKLRAPAPDEAVKE